MDGGKGEFILANLTRSFCPPSHAEKERKRGQHSVLFLRWCMILHSEE